MKISVIGCGRWGTFIAWYLDKLNNQVTLIGREGSERFSALSLARRNDYVTLPESVRFSTDMNGKAAMSDVIIISVGAQNLRGLLATVDKNVLSEKIFILSMKGVESNSGKRLSQVAEECGINKDNLAVWLGPGHIQEFVLGKPNCMVIDSANVKLTAMLVEAFRSDLIRFYYGDDLIGNEIGAAAKNVLGICAGILDGANMSTLKGALMARGAREVARLIRAMGGSELSAYGLCHLGDYETTLFSRYSHNRAFGEAYFKKEKFDKLAEGVETARALKLLGEKYGVELPITNAVYSILFESKDPLKQLSSLFSRSATKEFL